jgi:hypothetical protein
MIDGPARFVNHPRRRMQRLDDQKAWAIKCL